MLVAVLLGFVTIYLSALKSAYKASKVSPIDSIRNSSDIKIKAKKIKSPKLIGKIFGVGGDISYKNLKRNKKKYKTTVISIMVSVSIFIALSYFMNATFSEVSRMIGANDYNIFLQYNVTRDEQYGYIEKITKIDSIKDYSICRNIMLHLEEPKFSEEYLSLYDTDDIESLSANEKAYSIVAIGKEQYAKYLKELNLNYEDFKNKGIIQDNYSDSAHWLIRSLEIKDHEHLEEVYKDILFEIQERIARREGRKFMLNTADKIIIGGPMETLEIFLFNATITFIYISPHSSKFKNKV